MQVFIFLTRFMCLSWIIFYVVTKLHHAGRITHTDCIGWDIPGDNRPGTQDGTLADPDSRQDDNPHSYLYIILDDHGG